MIYLNQNLFSLDRQSVRENCNLFILFEQRGKVLISIYEDFFNNVELSYNDFANISNEVWKEPYNYMVIDITKNKNINGKLRINWDRRVLYLTLCLSLYLNQMDLRSASYTRSTKLLTQTVC